jgi:hypothetical protein
MKTETTKKVLLSVSALLPTMIAANLALAASPDTQKIESLIRQEMNNTASIYTQVTSRCRIQSLIFWFSSRKRTQRNDESFPSSLTMKWDRIWAPKGEFN